MGRDSLIKQRVLSDELVPGAFTHVSARRIVLLASQDDAHAGSRKYENLAIVDQVSSQSESHCLDSQEVTSDYKSLLQKHKNELNLFMPAIQVCVGGGGGFMSYVFPFCKKDSHVVLHLSDAKPYESFVKNLNFLIQFQKTINQNDHLAIVDTRKDCEF